VGWVDGLSGRASGRDCAAAATEARLLQRMKRPKGSAIKIPCRQSGVRIQTKRNEPLVAAAM
jgi:hypothetical protein